MDRYGNAALKEPIMKSSFSAMARLKFSRPKVTLPPDALAAADFMTRAMHEFGLPDIPEQNNTSPLERARYLLKAAAEIEHGLLVQYLYGAYSAPGGDSRRGTIRDIAVQEMDHLL